MKNDSTNKEVSKSESKSSAPETAPQLSLNGEIHDQAIIEINRITENPKTPPAVKRFLSEYLLEKVGMSVEVTETDTQTAADKTVPPRKDVTSYRPNRNWENLRNVTEEIVFLVSGDNQLIDRSERAAVNTAVEMLLIFLECLSGDDFRDAQDNISALNSYLYTLTSNFDTAEENFRRSIQSGYKARLDKAHAAECGSIAPDAEPASGSASLNLSMPESKAVDYKAAVEPDAYRRADPMLNRQ